MPVNKQINVFVRIHSSKLSLWRNMVIKRALYFSCFTRVRPYDNKANDTKISVSK